MPTYPLETLGCTIGPSGISAPTFDEIFTSLQYSHRAIYGGDSYIDPDSQDGQMLAVYAKGISDTNDATVAVYNNFSPATSQGAGLSAGVKLNGLQRRIPSYSTVDVRIVGVRNTIITNGVVTDANGKHQWALPETVIIPDAGEIVVTAACLSPGSITATADSVTRIATPTLGWQTVTNPFEATPGASVELDAQLRRRQARATGLPSLSTLGALYSALSDLAGVADVWIHENFTGDVDAEGTPEHSVSVVITGGDVNDIAAMIALKKSQGCDTFGTTTILTTSAEGVPIFISFSRPTDLVVDVVVQVEAGAGYSTDVIAAQVNAVTGYLNGLRIGESLFFNRLWIPAQLAGPVYGSAYTGTFQVEDLTANGAGVNIAVTYNQRIVAGAVTVEPV